MNLVILTGRLGKDPERKTVGETSVTTFSLATSRKYKNKQGDTQEDTQWHNIVAWGKQGEVIAQYMNKGSEIALRGEIQYRSWETDGQKKYITEIRLDSFDFIGGKVEVNQSNRTPVAQPEEAEVIAGAADDEELPF